MKRIGETGERTCKVRKAIAETVFFCIEKKAEDE